MAKKNPDFRFNRRRKSGKTEFFEVHIERAVITHLITALFVIFRTFLATCAHVLMLWLNNRQAKAEDSCNLEASHKHDYETAILLCPSDEVHSCGNPIVFDLTRRGCIKFNKRKNVQMIELKL